MGEESQATKEANERWMRGTSLELRWESLERLLKV